MGSSGSGSGGRLPEGSSGSGSGGNLPKGSLTSSSSTDDECIKRAIVLSERQTNAENIANEGSEKMKDLGELNVKLDATLKKIENIIAHPENPIDPSELDSLEDEYKSIDKERREKYPEGLKGIREQLD
ncbi:MAG: hypothetical protein M1834_009466 [Cirrosporium novae-zelandiae]|nr:MAG: hypothetical protein M1834_009466 [Cirrosporium novae-zelandiae]